ncbi:Homologous-pairing protein 2 [Golovinomyces cichoracearum]|uniref:Homologous-pairing protein 2 n=1 Tax=Golovinomyces cichoracearum TaxID=62708 RepID=A0A420I4G6_9PEZI|nr:Homologous-pairing protein 2 [Golovinomyces cichoracearum]
MPPRKHKIDEDETDPLSPSSHKTKIDQSKTSKQKPEKKVKADKPKKEKVENKKVETTLTKTAKDVKEKVVTLHGDEAMDLMMNYLREQNRPYSVTEISANLHGKVSKSVADKLLKEMSESGKINAKSTRGNEKGSQWIFWALQDTTDNANSEELNCMDDKIQDLKDAIKELKINLKSTTKKLESIKSTPTSAELAANVERLREENKSKMQRLEGYKNGQIKVVTKEEVSKVQNDFLYWTTKRLARKRAFHCLEDYFIESKPREELWEEAGIEEDTFYA